MSIHILTSNKYMFSKNNILPHLYILSINTALFLAALIPQIASPQSGKRACLAVVLQPCVSVLQTLQHGVNIAVQTQV